MSTDHIDPGLLAGNCRPMAGYQARHFLWQVNGRVATVTLNRPERKNALSGEMLTMLNAALQRAAQRAVDAEAPSCSSEAAVQRQPPPVNRAIAMLAYDLLWSLFRDGSLAIHGYLARIAPVQVTPLPIDPATWSFFGYSKAA